MFEPGHRKLDGIQVTLKNADLWRRFSAVGTEMIITKTGRRMFPSLVVEVSGLEPDACYFITLEMCLSSNSRYKFDSTRWVATGKAEMQLAAGSRLFIHPDSPATGSDWMNQVVSFQKVKLTNNSMNRGGQVLLSSMQKYIPKVRVVKASDVLALQLSPSASFTFPETEFIAVTAYQV
ncbi:T-box transcription factor TBX6 [Anabrus simplex]|uniref:T-box transcription factor TBX6 n=1 Tax=Anabrus simplex TaxID=316456 RepID=UPI0035A33E09